VVQVLADPSQNGQLTGGPHGERDHADNDRHRELVVLEQENLRHDSGGSYHEARSASRRPMVEDVVGREPNDPAKGAAAIVKVLDAENPPLRLLLGDDAVDGLRRHHEALLADVTTWEALSRSTAIS
jgi:hypothetical protein